MQSFRSTAIAELKLRETIVLALRKNLNTVAHEQVTIRLCCLLELQHRACISIAWRKWCLMQAFVSNTETRIARQQQWQQPHTHTGQHHSKQDGKEQQGGLKRRSRIV